MYNIYSLKNKELIETGKKLLVGYMLAGYKDKDNFFQNLKICQDSALNILEIGFPSKNPYADGEVISKAHSMVNHDEAGSIEFWKEIRNQTNKSIWLMAYFYDFIDTDKYIEFAKANVIDAVVIPDTSFDTRLSLKKELSKYNIDVIGFTNPLMKKEETLKVLDNFPIVYEQLYFGQTGVQPLEETYHEMLNMTLEHKRAKAFAGFGLNSFGKIKKVLDEGFDGAIVGTEILRKINDSSESLKSFLKEIGKAVTK